MRYRLLGRSGLRVSDLCLGTMTFGTEWGFGCDRDEALRQMARFAELGGNFVDTANHYTRGASERIVGEGIAADRDRWVVATKYTLYDREGDANGAGNHRKSLVQALEGSLRRLGTDRVDLLWVHAWDFTVAPDEVMRALDDQVRLGKVLHVGISDTPAWIVSRAQTLAELRGWTPFTALQVEHSLVERTVERELIPMARALGLAVTPWSPLGGGLLSGKYGDGVPPDARLKAGVARLSARNLAIAKVTGEVAAELGTTSARVALAWVRGAGAALGAGLGATGTVTVPIIGARTMAQLEDNLGCLSVELPAEARARLDAASAIELGFPHQFLSNPATLTRILGTERERIEPPTGRA